ncbi:MAG: ImmA/IrrE family metallo-endopeptidase [Planctomycetaceae bacterium]|nr:ImmA/IrrE family metallo-endopeptidase [Planctomycetaceae bacterium]
MFPHLTQEEFADCLDAVVGEFLAAADWEAPPVDALELARRAGIALAIDSRLAGRARTVRLRSGTAGGQASILLRPEPRSERRQWAVAHEIGEQLARHVFAAGDVTPAETSEAAREQVANLLAARLLLPTAWYERDARGCGWDLFELKRSYSTASHELLARRMLDCAPLVIISLFDQGQLAWRKSNAGGRTPSLTAAERSARDEAHGTLTTATRESPWGGVVAWPIHEPEWKREILRAELPEFQT